MAKKQRVRYEFYNFQTGTTGLSNNTLVLENPASVKFVVTGFGVGGDIVTINNAYQLQSINLFSTIGSQYPYELLLENNQDEIDVTTYTINIVSPANSINLKVIAKYFIG